jgi:hypothetical protein
MVCIVKFSLRDSKNWLPATNRDSKQPIFDGTMVSVFVDDSKLAGIGIGVAIRKTAFTIASAR